MSWQELDVVPHWTARGCFDEVALEVAAKTIAHGFGEELEGLRHDLRVMRELPGPLRFDGLAPARAGGNCPPGVPDDLARSFVLSQAGHGVPRSGRKALRGGVPLIERPFKSFDRRLGFGTLLLEARLLEPSLEILVRSPRKSDAALSLATLIIKRAQCGLFLLCLVPYPLELSFEGREFLLRIISVDAK